jgi:hypothetical protein
MNREVRSKSKLRSALRKCKDALIRQPQVTDDKLVVSPPLNTQWYLNDDNCDEKLQNENANIQINDVSNF